MCLGFLKNYCDIESKNRNLNCQQQDRKVTGNVKVERTSKDTHGGKVGVLTNVSHLHPVMSFNL